MLMLPITMLTAGVSGILAVILALRVVLARTHHGISLGDGGNADAIIRIRTHANFIENVPLILILMGLIESAQGESMWLKVAGALLILFRIAHFIGLPMRAPNPFRLVGAAGTFTLMMILGGYLIYLSILHV